MFISYRRQEASYLAAWLYDYLGHLLGSGSVFLDIDSIKPGVDFFRLIVERVSESAVLVLIIGNQWLAADRSGHRRIDDPDDLVRIEVETALSRDVSILPVLLDDAVMPDGADLPESVRLITRINAVSVRRETARRDIELLGSAISGLLGGASVAAQGASTALDQVEKEVEEHSLDAQSPSPVHELDAGHERDQRRRLLLQLGDVYRECEEQIRGDRDELRLQLGLDLVPAKTASPADQLLPSRPGRSEALPVGTTLIDVLDRSYGLEGDGVLVLGGPGAGKTGMLFELARHLRDRADESPRWPVPMYIPLSGWNKRCVPMGHWMVRRLEELYQVPPRLGHDWMESGRVLFLLDGLDEIPGLVDRQSCVDEINRFTRFGRTVSLPMVVTSRSAEYDGLSRKLHVQTAVSIRPLDPWVTLEHLERPGAGVEGALVALRREPGLMDLLRSPLMANMITSAYSDLTRAGRLSDGDPLEPGELVISHYVDRCLRAERREGVGKDRFPPGLSHRWLRSLARYLTERHQTVLLLDRLDPRWLRTSPVRRIPVLGPPVAWGVLSGAAFGVALDRAEELGIDETTYPVHPSLFYSALGCLVGLAVGLVSEWGTAARVAAWLSVGVLSGLIFSIATTSRGYVDVGLYALEFTLFVTILGELAAHLLGGVLPLAEHLSLSWKKVREALRYRLPVGVVLGCALAVLDSLSSGGDLQRALFLGLISGLVLGLFFGLSIGLGSGLRISPVPTRVLPTEGVWRSAQHGAVVGVAATGMVGFFFFIGGLTIGPSDALVRALAWGPGAGLLLGLTAGLGAALQYLLLRLLLWGSGLAPLRYHRWLDDMVQLRLLYRGVGGSYLFIHQVVQEHFARVRPSVAPSRADVP